MMNVNTQESWTEYQIYNLLSHLYNTQNHCPDYIQAFYIMTKLIPFSSLNQHKITNALTN